VKLNDLFDWVDLGKWIKDAEDMIDELDKLLADDEPWDDLFDDVPPDLQQKIRDQTGEIIRDVRGLIDILRMIKAYRDKHGTTP
jgi:hypothetical protein